MPTRAETVTTPEPEPFREPKPRSLWSDASRTFARNKAGMAGLIVACLVVLLAIFAPWIAPYDFAHQIGNTCAKVRAGLTSWARIHWARSSAA